MNPPTLTRDAWLCCHLGAREHYAVPRSLNRLGVLKTVVTDAWAVPGGVWSGMPGTTGRRLSERFAPELERADVRDLTTSLVAHEVSWRVQGLTGWPLAIARNEWFQERAARVVRDARVEPGASAHVFAHSYSALAVLREAKARGFTAVLGQIDPGIEHFHLVERLAVSWPEYGAAPEAPPPGYFASWREECELADWIVVNSDWSRESLERAGITRTKLKVIPLPYEPENDGVFSRRYPAAFTPDRPLKALFVGSAAVSKGLPSLLGAIDLLSDVPVELRLVGEVAATIPPAFRDHRAIRWIGPVSRSEVMSHCRESDVLVFPSHSDGFGMAQVEAQGWNLPIIASRFCGRVVEDGVNGLLLPEVSAVAIAGALRRVAREPQLLVNFASHAGTGTVASIADLGTALSQLVAA